jgi:hypothetical protein
MFSFATMTCRCGFATSDESLYECPACGTVWRERPKAAKTAGPTVGTKVELLCAVCGEPFDGVRSPVFAGGTELAHEDCINVSPTEDSPYLKVVAQAEPPKPKRKRKRKRKPRNRPIQAEAPEA